MPKKPQITEFSIRLNKVLDHFNIKAAGLAVKVECSSATISKILRSGRGIGRGLAESIHRHYGVSIEWLRFGKGEMLYAAKSEADTGMGDELAVLLEAAERVLKSNTHYAHSLAANIISFEKGLKSEQNHEQRIARLEKKDGSILKCDSVKKKDESC